MKRGQETNHILKQEARTQDTHKTPLTVWVKIIHFSFMPKIIRILRSCSMKIFSKFPTVNISKLNFWLVICIANIFADIFHTCVDFYPLFLDRNWLKTYSELLKYQIRCLFMLLDLFSSSLTSILFIISPGVLVIFSCMKSLSHRHIGLR